MTVPFSREVVADRDGFLVAPFELLSGFADAFRSLQWAAAQDGESCGCRGAC